MVNNTKGGVGKFLLTSLLVILVSPFLVVEPNNNHMKITDSLKATYDLISKELQAKQSMSHEAIVAKYPEDGANAIGALYLNDKVGISADGVCYWKY